MSGSLVPLIVRMTRLVSSDICWLLMTVAACSAEVMADVSSEVWLAATLSSGLMSCSASCNAVDDIDGIDDIDSEVNGTVTEVHVPSLPLSCG